MVYCINITLRVFEGNVVFIYLNKNSDIYWKPTKTIESDPASFIVKLAESLKGFKGNADWINTLREKDNAKEQLNQ